MIAGVELKQTLTGFAGHTVRIYRGRYAGPRYPKGRRNAKPWRYKVTIDSTDMEDQRWRWEDSVSGSAAIALLEVAGYQWELELQKDS